MKHEISYIAFLQMFCVVPRSENLAPHQSAVLLCGCLCCCCGTLWSLISFGGVSSMKHASTRARSFIKTLH